jgi:hypothetical protein
MADLAGRYRGRLRDRVSGSWEMDWLTAARDLPHYRNTLSEGQTSTSIFFHYVAAGLLGVFGLNVKSSHCPI